MKASMKMKNEPDPVLLQLQIYRMQSKKGYQNLLLNICGYFINNSLKAYFWGEREGKGNN
jgi:hypothetical protein